MEKTQWICPECELEMHPIKLLDATDSGMGGQGIAHTELSYAAVDSVASFFTRTIPRLGVVQARMCPECGHINLYGRPSSSSSGLLRRP